MTSTATKMRIFTLYCIIVQFFNILHFSTVQCDTTTNCPVTKLERTKSLEIGILYDLTGKVTDTAPEALVKLDGIVCAVIKASGGIVKLKRKPGATVTVENEQIKCADDCNRLRYDACKGLIDSNYFTNCDGASVLMSEINDCIAAKKSDEILIGNGALKRKLGIQDSKLPALTFNDKYESCKEFQTEEDLQSFVCSIYDNTIPGCAKGASVK